MASNKASPRALPSCGRHVQSAVCLEENSGCTHPSAGCHPGELALACLVASGRRLQDATFSRDA